MPVVRSPEGRIYGWELKTGRQRLLEWFAWFALVALTVFCWRVMTADTIWAFVEDTPKQAADLFGRMLPPRWS